LHDKDFYLFKNMRMGSYRILAIISF